MQENEESVFNSARVCVCESCIDAIRKIVGTAKELSFNDQMEFAEFLFLGGGSEAAVTARTRIRLDKI